ncbi:hypothetical protein B484DRAFT_359243 [Ochromonadaceae sp. CCMP2298]|nr:hypothetical protein B484DRAFT_359243 [Ochromonadaceae sp. CCMP2298]
MEKLMRAAQRGGRDKDKEKGDKDKDKGGKKGKKGKAQARAPSPTPSVSTVGLSVSTIAGMGGIGGKKKINRKKARRYAEQDEEDRDLAMLVLGHGDSRGERLVDLDAKLVSEKKAANLRARQERAGIQLVDESWESLLGAQDSAVGAVLEGLIGGGLLRQQGFDAFEMGILGEFSPQQGVEILALFGEGVVEKQMSVGNASGFLAGIMRRYAGQVERRAEAEAAEAAAAVAAVVEVEAERAEAGAGEAVGRKKKASGDKDKDKGAGEKGGEPSPEELAEMQALLEQQGGEDEEVHDNVEQLTGFPKPEDELLYALPVCAPYSSLQHFKYKVKLTPGAGKKGKVARQALELFAAAKECSEAERGLIKALTDAEVVAVMVGDVKLSMPGLFTRQAVQKSQKKSQRGQKKG